jgi:transcriptional regulator with XRE-family HTH domain
MYLNTNLKFLRTRNKLTQQDLANALEVGRSALNGYEHQQSVPTIETILKISTYFKISVDTLLKVDLKKLPESKISELEKGIEDYIKGKYLRIVSTTVNKDNEDNIELVPVKAQAGYAKGYADNEFISKLPRYYLPFLDKNRKYRTFEIKGDSMLPIKEGGLVTCEYVEDWMDIRNGLCYIILLKDDGIVFKRIFNEIQKEKRLILVSNNVMYKPYTVKIEDVVEVWKYVMDYAKTLE